MFDIFIMNSDGSNPVNLTNSSATDSGPAWRPSIDEDNDGIPDDIDECTNSDLSQTVVIDGCDTGVQNELLGDGCSINDLIGECADNATNHGNFVSCVSKLTNDLKKSGIITGQEKGAIQSCAAQANIP